MRQLIEYMDSVVARLFIAGCVLFLVPHHASAATRKPETPTVVAQSVGAKDDQQPPAEAKPRRKPTLLPSNKRRSRSSTPPPLTREDPSERSVRSRKTRQAIEPAPLPPARDPPGDRGAPLGVPPHLDPRWIPATPPIGYPPLPPARQVPGETGVPLGPGPLSPVR